MEVSEDSKPLLETVRVQNFGCVHDVTLELTRLHALIGPNDSGKSTVLSALRVLGHQLGTGPSSYFDIRTKTGTSIFLKHSDSSATLHFADQGWLTEGDIQLPRSHTRGVTFVRWSPDIIRQPCPLIPEGQSLVIGERGERLAAIYEAILSSDRSAFAQIEASVQHHFPTVKGIRLPTNPTGQKELGVILKDGTRVPAGTVSEGLLYWLAFAILPYTEPTGLLLIEEPENGLHPSRIAEVMTILRAISQTTQVILATHSPLVINELEPNEVTILTRDEATGTRATRMDRTNHFQQRQKVYALGELWLSFADGDTEEALVPSDTTTAAS